MHSTLWPLGYSDPLPLSATEYDVRHYMAARATLGTGIGLPRTLERAEPVGPAAAASRYGTGTRRHTQPRDTYQHMDGQGPVVAVTPHHHRGRITWDFSAPVILAPVSVVAWRALAHRRDEIRRRYWYGHRVDTTAAPDRFRPFDPRPIWDADVVKLGPFGQIIYVGR